MQVFARALVLGNIVSVARLAHRAASEPEFWSILGTDVDPWDVGEIVVALQVQGLLPAPLLAEGEEGEGGEKGGEKEGDAALTPGAAQTRRRTRARPRGRRAKTQTREPSADGERKSRAHSKPKSKPRAAAAAAAGAGIGAGSGAAPSKP